jgi:hypothetical protein
MKIVKIIFGVLAALWALAYIPPLLVSFSHRDAPLASSSILGAVACILFATAISIAFFRSAFKR